MSAGVQLITASRCSKASSRDMLPSMAWGSRQGAGEAAMGGEGRHKGSRQSRASLIAPVSLQLVGKAD